MTITLNGTTGITNDGGYTGDGVSFADNAPSNSLVVNSSGNVGIGTSSPATKLEVVGTYKQKYAVGNSQGFTISQNASDDVILSNYYNATMRFETNNTERMRIDSSGNLLVGTTSTLVSPGGKLQIYATRGYTHKSDNSGFGLPCQFLNSAGAEVGYISTNNTNTAYITSSDYRLKENIQPMQNALATVAQLNPVTYTWKADGSDGQGFIAHELQAVVPDCVTGEKDAVDAEGNPVYQGIDTSFLVATLTKAIQELKAEVDDLKAQLEAK